MERRNKREKDDGVYESFEKMISMPNTFNSFYTFDIDTYREVFEYDKKKNEDWIDLLSTEEKEPNNIGTAVINHLKSGKRKNLYDWEKRKLDNFTFRDIDLIDIHKYAEQDIIFGGWAFNKLTMNNQKRMVDYDINRITAKTIKDARIVTIDMTHDIIDGRWGENRRKALLNKINEVLEENPGLKEKTSILLKWTFFKDCRLMSETFKRYNSRFTDDKILVCGRLLSKNDNEIIIKELTDLINYIDCTCTDRYSTYRNIVALVLQTLSDSTDIINLESTVIEKFIGDSVKLLPKSLIKFINYEDNYCIKWIKTLISNQDTEKMIFENNKSLRDSVLNTVLSYKAITYEQFNNLKEKYKIKTNDSQEIKALNYLEGVRSRDVINFMRKKLDRTVRDTLSCIDLNIGIDDIKLDISIPNEDSVDLLLEIERYKYERSDL